MKPRTCALAALLLSLAPTWLGAQLTTGTIQGTIRDEQGAVVPGASVTLVHLDTNAKRTLQTDEAGRFRASNLAVGDYELVAELSGFSTHRQTGLRLALNQDAVLEVVMKAASVAETIQVRADTPVLNTTSAEVGVRFDTKRIAELPMINSRDIFSVALSAPGVSQLGAGQSEFASGVNFSSNGMRVRSNNFMIDGQDSNDPSVTGRQQWMNNTDVIQEVRLITNQFAAEYGRAAGSVVNVITKSGGNAFHGSGFAFHNNDEVNARSNLDKAVAGRDKAPFRLETQYGGTLGGPVLRNRTFFFGSYQRWTDRRLGSGQTLNGAPTDAGRQVLQSAAGDLPQIAALLKHLPAGSGFVKNATFARAGQTYTVPLGSVTGSADILRNNNQGSVRIDQQLGLHSLGGRYLYNGNFSDGVDSQVTPPGLTTVVPSNQHATNAWLTSILTSRATNEFRVSHQHLGTETNAATPSSEEIPSIQIAELGLAEFNAGPRRTAIGLAANLPQFRYNDTYQVQNTFTYVPGNHAFKFGVDFRHIYVKSFFFPQIRGNLQYPTLQAYVDDNPEGAQINKPLPGGQSITYYEWDDLFLFAQDEWRLRPDLTLTLGLRYERPGNSIKSLIEDNQAIVDAAGGDSRYLFAPQPEADTNNFQPRVGFNWHPQTSGSGVLGRLTGGDKLVLRGGYARTHDYAFLNIALNIASSFPFVAAINPADLRGAYARLPTIEPTGDPNLFVRTVVAGDFRSPYANQFSLELQRELMADLSMRVGYVGTHGRDLFQTIDGNPTLEFSRAPVQRVDPTRGVIRLRANEASSDYHSLQVGVDKRSSGGLSAGAHYTWSKYMDDASEVFNVSAAEIAVSQDSYNREDDRAVSSYDRTHRFTTNVVWELPFLRGQTGALGRALGGWTIATTFTLQSGSPFTALNGADPTNALTGISGLVGNAIRPNLNTDLDISNMTIEQIREAGGATLFRALCGFPSATCAGERVGNVGRNTLRADGIGNLDFSVIKNTRIGRSQALQLRIEMFNATNTRNFGVPNGVITSANFLNQWGTDGGNRRIWGAVRYTF